MTVVGIWGIKYNYTFKQKNELKLGIAYMISIYS